MLVAVYFQIAFLISKDRNIIKINTPNIIIPFDIYEFNPYIFEIEPINIIKIEIINEIMIVFLLVLILASSN